VKASVFLKGTSGIKQAITLKVQSVAQKEVLPAVIRDRAVQSANMSKAYYQAMLRAVTEAVKNPPVPAQTEMRKGLSTRGLRKLGSAQRGTVAANVAWHETLIYGAKARSPEGVEGLGAAQTFNFGGVKIVVPPSKATLPLPGSVSGTTESNWKKLRYDYFMRGRGSLGPRSRRLRSRVFWKKDDLAWNYLAYALEKAIAAPYRDFSKDKLNVVLVGKTRAHAVFKLSYPSPGGEWNWLRVAFVTRNAKVPVSANPSSGGYPMQMAEMTRPMLRQIAAQAGKEFRKNLDAAVFKPLPNPSKKQ